MFEVKGVKGVLLGYDLIKVKKEDGEWKNMKNEIIGKIMENLM